MEKLDCGHYPSIRSGFGTGYGTVNNKKYCYECCADMDKKQMIEEGKITLYLNAKSQYVTNWPGTLRIKLFPTMKKGSHNIARVRRDFWFPFNGHIWHGVNYGDWSDLAYCKQTKEKL